MVAHLAVTQIPQFQRAWRVVSKGHPSNAVVLQDNVPVPTSLGPGEVLVRVHAAALNPIGYKVMKMLPNWFMRRPHVAEHDLSGTVVIPNGSGFNEGDQVFGWIPFELCRTTGQGCLAQYAKLPAAHLSPKPRNISLLEASAIALSGGCAYKGLVDVAKIEAGQTVFVNGGTTTVGSYAIQIAKAKGCNVVTSCSNKNVEYVKALGADEVFDYTSSPLHEQLRSHSPIPRYHVLFDCVGITSPDLYTASSSYLAPNGVFLSTGPNIKDTKTFFEVMSLAFSAFIRPTWLGGVKSQFTMVHVTNKRENLDALGKLVSEGKMKVNVDSVYEFGDVQKAYARSMSGKARGKIIVKVEESSGQTWSLP